MNSPIWKRPARVTLAFALMYTVIALTVLLAAAWFDLILRTLVHQSAV